MQHNNESEWEEFERSEYNFLIALRLLTVYRDLILKYDIFHWKWAKEAKPIILS